MNKTLFTVPDLGTFSVWSNNGRDVGLSTEWAYKNVPGVSESVRISRVDYAVNFFLYCEGHPEIEGKYPRTYRGWGIRNEALYRALTRPHTGGEYGTDAARGQLWDLIVVPFIDWLHDTDEGKQMLADAVDERRLEVAKKAAEKAHELQAEAQRLEMIALDAADRKPISPEDESYVLYGKQTR